LLAGDWGDFPAETFPHQIAFDFIHRTAEVLRENRKRMGMQIRVLRQRPLFHVALDRHEYAQLIGLRRPQEACRERFGMARLFEGHAALAQYRQQLEAEGTHIQFRRSAQSA